MPGRAVPGGTAPEGDACSQVRVPGSERQGQCMANRGGPVDEHPPALCMHARIEPVQLARKLAAQ